MKLDLDCIDVKQAVHSVALEYAKMELQHLIDCEKVPSYEPQTCLDYMYSTYLRAVGYLTAKGNDYVENEINSF